MRGSEAVRATREAYDVVAPDYARLLPDMSVEAPPDLAVLAAFVGMVGQSVAGLVAEVGCGSGRVTAHLADTGLPMLGLDLSPGMVAAARSAHPDLLFAAAHAGALPLHASSLAGLVAWYSLIHFPSSVLPEVLDEFARVLQPGAPLVVAFQSGSGERVDRATSYGHPVPLIYYRHRLEDVADALAGARFTLQKTLHREPSQAHETTSQAFLLAARR